MDTTERLAAGRHDLIKGKRLSWFRTPMLAEAAAYFRDKERKALSIQCAQLSRESENIAHQRRCDPSETDESRAVVGLSATIDAIIRNGTFNINREAFNSAVQDLSNLPMLLWISLRVAHPECTLEEAESYLTPENENTMHEAIKELMGYVLKKKFAVDDKGKQTDLLVAAWWEMDRKNLLSNLEKYSTSSQTDLDTPKNKSAA